MSTLNKDKVITILKKCFDPEIVNNFGNPYSTVDFSRTEFFPKIQKFIDTKLSILKKYLLSRKLLEYYFIEEI